MISSVLIAARFLCYKEYDVRPPHSSFFDQKISLVNILFSNFHSTKTRCNEMDLISKSEIFDYRIEWINLSLRRILNFLSSLKIIILWTQIIRIWIQCESVRDHNHLNSLWERYCCKRTRIANYDKHKTDDGHDNNLERAISLDRFHLESIRFSIFFATTKILFRPREKIELLLNNWYDMLIM